jgi:hypothetical protein
MVAKHKMLVPAVFQTSAFLQELGYQLQILDTLPCLPFSKRMDGCWNQFGCSEEEKKSHPCQEVNNNSPLIGLVCMNQMK